MTVRFPAPLRPGDLVGVTAPSSGVPEVLRPRLEFCVQHLRERGYRVRLGGGAWTAPASSAHPPATGPPS